MLSNESQLIFDILCDITGGSEGYKIVDADEITEKFPPDTSFTKVQLSQMIRELKDTEYVDIKYFTPDEYCLRVIKRAPEPVKTEGDVKADAAVDAAEPAKEKERALYGERKGAARPGLVLFMSFLGGILGSGFVAAITALMLKFVI